MILKLSQLLNHFLKIHGAQLCLRSKKFQSVTWGTNIMVFEVNCDFSSMIITIWLFSILIECPDSQKRKIKKATLSWPSVRGIHCRWSIFSGSVPSIYWAPIMGWRHKKLEGREVQMRRPVRHTESGLQRLIILWPSSGVFAALQPSDPWNPL